VIEAATPAKVLFKRIIGSDPARNYQKIRWPVEEIFVKLPCCRRGEITARPVKPTVNYQRLFALFRKNGACGNFIRLPHDHENLPKTTLQEIGRPERSIDCAGFGSEREGAVLPAWAELT
jgi:hypothetical protein